jgi:hypothetical protein
MTKAALAGISGFYCYAQASLAPWRIADEQEFGLFAKGIGAPSIMWTARVPRFCSILQHVSAGRTLLAGVPDW